jgi:hypothetical protein
VAADSVRRYNEETKQIQMKPETIIKKIEAIQKKVEDVKIKFDGEMNVLYFMLDDLYYKLEKPTKKKSK